MRTATALPAFYADAQRLQDRLPPQPGSKRKFSSLGPPSRQTKHDYPSPPMSSPPSPPSSVPEPARIALIETGPRFHASGTTVSPITTTNPPHAHAFYNPPLVSSTRPSLPPAPPAPFSTLPTLGIAPLRGSGHHSLPSFGVLQPVTNGTLPTTGFAATSGLSTEPISRSGRKSKAHVASACVNCKRAHLSCDIQRPCARCVASGKQDSCYDVQHKKRGRPRLREEGEFKIEQMDTEQPLEATIALDIAQTTSRPVATPRQRRADSLRSLRSQTSETSSLLTSNLPPPSTLQSPFAYSRPPSGFNLAPAEVPTAFLDVDLIFLRANQPFQQILSDGQDVKGHLLGDFATPADNESFEAIRSRLRAERETREPNYMPPILQSGQDPIQGVSEADIGRLSATFADITYTWTRSRTGSTTENFPARVRLAKTTSYFVVVTLPSFRPTPALASSPVAPSPFAMSPLSSRGMQSAPPQPPLGYQPPLAASSLPSSRRASLSAYSYPSSQLGTPHQQATVPSMSQSHQSELPIERAVSPSRAMARDTMPPPTIGSQLPQLREPAAAVSVTAASGRAAEPPHTLSEEEEEDGSPKKRRRLGIEEVIQR